MAGYKGLGNGATERILEKNFSHTQVAAGDDLNQSFKYCIETIDDDNQLLVILTPIHLIPNQQDIGSVLTGFRQRIPEFQTRQHRFHVLAGVVGNGVTERHIVSMYVPPNGDIHFFDPKASDREKFFSDKLIDQTFSWRRLFPALWNSLSPRPTSSFTLSDGEDINRPAVHFALGTQSFYDGVSCGYHHAAQLLVLKHLIMQGKRVTVDALLDKLRNPVHESSEALKQTPYESQATNRFLAFMKKAWLDTYLPDKIEEEREPLHFGHYFMGWPSQKGTFRKVVYFLTLGFILNPLINVIKLPELLANGISESFSFLKNSLINWAPTHPATQFFRSGLLLSTIGLQGLFKGLYFAIRTVTSPVTSFKEAWRIHPALGILSAVVSLTVYAALVYFAAPVVVPILMAAGPAAAPAFNALAYPLVQLFGLIGVSLTTGTAAAGTLTLGAVIVQAGRLLLNKLVDTVEKKLPKKEAIQKPVQDSKLPNASNVNEVFKKNGIETTSKEEKDAFVLVNPSKAPVDGKKGAAPSVKSLDIEEASEPSKLSDLGDQTSDSLESGWVF
ncbi:hypothetical protein Lrub_1933 [Legionella rubrilucens]|uniref:Uncharacterized protein n=1 Tax=Legionella rubrilucens TaxID=458 RepID=A0A0W0XRK3_9GAMM|nr:hypothetical protein [Legionella rubrilucens]KTD47011.1 hypothetical protein Lrub_1933 [Legionella rubrilucens]